MKQSNRTAFLTRGLRDLVHDAIDGITGLVEETHEAAARKPVELLARVPQLEEAVRGVDEVRRFTASTVFGGVRAVNHAVRVVGDAVESASSGLAEAARAFGADDDSHRERAVDPTARAVGAAASARAWIGHAQGGLNAVIGDFLAAKSNGLAIDLGFWHEGSPLTLTAEALARALPKAAPKLCVFVHGLGCTERVFRLNPGRARRGGPERVDYGERLEMEQGFTPIYVRYNSGLHVSQNGRALASALDELVAAFPVPVQQVALVGHSMGGLVARSAAHYAAADARAFGAQLTHVLCIGSPHLGAPMEKASNALASALGLFDVAGTQVPAKLLNARSAGIKDLRYGYVLDEEWTGRDPDSFLRDERRDVPFAKGVVYGSIAARYHADLAHPLGELLGDMLVRVPSASGRAPDERRCIPFHLGEVVAGVHHQALLTHPTVYEKLVGFLAERAR